MYERFWNFDRAPFDQDRRPEAFYPSLLHGEALVKLKYLVEHGKGAAALIGASGTGKTHILEQIRWQAESHGPVVHLVYPQLSPQELVSFVTHSLGGDADESPSSDAGLDVLLHQLEIRLRELTAAGRKPLIMVDDAHLIEDRKVFQTLQQLMNYQRPGRTNFGLILAGQPELVATMQRTDQFADRVAFHCLLRPLTETQTAEYIRHRLKVAGRIEPIFDSSAVKTIFELSAGVPRRINRLCDFALLIGYANQFKSINAEQVEEVHSEITRSLSAA